MKSERLLMVCSALLLCACAGTVVLPVQDSLPHEEVVARLQQLFKQEAVMDWDMIAGAQTRISATRTRLAYHHTKPQPPPSLYTPAFVHDRTAVEIDTSQPDQVRISVQTSRPGNFFRERVHDTETRISARLAALKARIDNTLRRTPAETRP